MSEKEEFQEMTPAEFKWAVHIERQAQIEKGYTAEHDDAKGAVHLANQAIDYARRGKPLKAAAIMVALIEHLERTSQSAEDVEEIPDDLSYEEQYSERS